MSPNNNAMPGRFIPAAWAGHTNIYEVNVRQYTEEGTFNAFAASLPRLKDMGVETLWFMPVQPVGLKNRKGALGSYYSISDYKSVNPEFGTIDDFKSLVQKAQASGFRVIIDWVANHTAWDHVWTISHPQFYSKSESGYFRPPYPEWEDVIHLNYYNRELREHMVDAMRFWVNETGIDGFRCDMAHLVPLDFWIEAREQLDSIKPMLWLAETEDVNYHQAFDISYTWEFLHQMEKYWRGETDVHGLKEVLHRYNDKFPPEAMRLYFTSNHDENSHSGSEYDRMGEAAAAFAVLCATWNGIPLIYSGQELPVRKKIAFFEKDAIQWEHAPRLHQLYKKILGLHSTHPALRAADDTVSTFFVKTSAPERVFCFARKKDEQQVLVLLNLSSSAVVTSVNDELVTGTFTSLFDDTSIDITPIVPVDLPAWGYQVFYR